MDKTVPMWVASLSDESWSTAGTDAGTTVHAGNSFCLAAAIYLVQLHLCWRVLRSWALVVTYSNSYCFALVLNSFIVLRTQSNCNKIFALVSYWFSICSNTDRSLIVSDHRCDLQGLIKEFLVMGALPFASTRMSLAKESCSLEPKGWRESFGEHYSAVLGTARNVRAKCFVACLWGVSCSADILVVQNTQRTPSLPLSGVPRVFRQLWDTKPALWKELDQGNSKGW